MDINIPLVVIVVGFLVAVVVITKMMTKNKNIKRHCTEWSFVNIFRFKSETEFEKES